MIVVRTRDSRVFEEAYFVMRRDTYATAVDDSDMLWEANRILENTVPHSRHEPRKTEPAARMGKLRGLLWYVMGLLSGGGLVGLLWFLI